MSNSPDGATEISAPPTAYTPELLEGEPRKREWREWLLLGLGCFLMAAALRFVRIGFGEYFGIEFRALDILQGKHDGGFFLSLLGGQRSIYYLLLGVWAHFCGVANEALMRLPSAVVGMLAWVSFFWFARSYLRGTAFLICILVFALNPILIETANDVSPFALLGLCTVLANFLAVRALDAGGAANWTMYAAACVLGLFTHPLFWFVLPPHWAFAALRRRRTPEPFRGISTVGVALGPLLAAWLAIYVNRKYPEFVGNRTMAPSISDLARNVVAVVVGNFPRFGANDFVRAVMYLFILACLGLSYVYYRKCTAEAMAMPENVVWIDETQDVVGHWKRLSLRAFLLFQWFTFVLPALGLIVMGSVLPGLRLTPDMFIVCLPSLIVLIAMGIDAAPRNMIVSMGLLLVLGMANYDVKTLSDRGYGIKEAFRRIREQVKFDPKHDVIIYTAPKHIERPVEYYRGNLPTNAIQSADTIDEYNARQKQLQDLLHNRDRAIVIYNDALRNLGKTENRSPVYEWLHPANGFELVKQFKWEWSPTGSDADRDKTELRVYNRRLPSPANSQE